MKKIIKTREGIPICEPVIHDDTIFLKIKRGKDIDEIDLATFLKLIFEGINK